MASLAGLTAGAAAATGVTVSKGDFALSAGLLLVAVVDVASAGLAGAGAGVGDGVGAGVVGEGSGFVLGAADTTGDCAGLEVSALEAARSGVVEVVLSSADDTLTSLAVELEVIRGTFSFTGVMESSVAGASPEGSVGGGARLKHWAISSNVLPLVSGTRK